KGCQRSVARADNLEGSLNEERSQQWRTVLADPPSPVLLPGLMNGGVQARVAHNLLGPLEALGITNMGYERRCYDRTHTGQADQSPGRVVVGQGPVDHAGDVVDLVFEMLPLAPQAVQDHQLRATQLQVLLPHHPPRIQAARDVEPCFSKDRTGAVDRPCPLADETLAVIQ